MENESPEARRAPRKNLRARAQVAAPAEPVQNGWTVDVSVSGVCIMLAEQVQNGAKCVIRFEVPVDTQKKIVQAAATAVYCVCVGRQGFRVGFHFSEPDPVRTNTIKAL